MMNLCNINEVKTFLASYGFHFSKSMGQNFLIDRNVPERIAEMSMLDDNTGVLEIGPGIGALTAELSKKAGKVVSVELDRDLLKMLPVIFSDAENVSFIEGDILKTDISRLVASDISPLRPVVCANLPYNITTPVIQALIDSDIFDTMTLMVQREVARRICADSGTSEYGSFSVYCSYYYEPEILFDVKPECFIPSPKVTSSVVYMKKRSCRPQKRVDDKTFFKVTRASFALKRKTLVNSLMTAVKGISKEKLTEIVVSLGHSPSVRGEQLDINEFSILAEQLKEYI